MCIRIKRHARINVQLASTRLHPYPEEARLPKEGTELVRRFNEHFYGPQDYTVIGFKP